MGIRNTGRGPSHKVAENPVKGGSMGANEKNNSDAGER